jgi:hypothetical protein
MHHVDISHWNAMNRKHGDEHRADSIAGLRQLR